MVRAAPVVPSSDDKRTPDVCVCVALMTALAVQYVGRKLDGTIFDSRCGRHASLRSAALRRCSHPAYLRHVTSHAPVTTYSRDLVDGKHVGGTDDPLKFIVGRGEVVPGFDAAVLSMAKVRVYAGAIPTIAYALTVVWSCMHVTVPGRGGQCRN